MKSINRTRRICMVIMLALLGTAGLSCTSQPKPGDSSESLESFPVQSHEPSGEVSGSDFLSVSDESIFTSSASADLSDPTSSKMISGSSSSSAAVSSSFPASSAVISSNPSSQVSLSSEDSSAVDAVKLTHYEKFLQKVQRGETVYVAYLGGSITAGASYANWGAANPYVGVNLDGTPIDTTQYWSYPSNDDLRDSWRSRVFHWLRTNYQVKNNQFIQINAAIGGTNSEFGALRLDDHVFARGIPDLIFIEYAVNDNGRGSYDIRASYESITQRVWAKNPDCAVFIALSPSRQKKDAANPAFYDVVRNICTITQDYADYKKIPYADIDRAYYHNGLTEAQKTALYYGPQADFGSQVHPSPYGHEIYANEVIRVLTSCFNTLTFPFNTKDIFVSPAYPTESRIYFGEDLVPYMPGSSSIKIPNDPRQHQCLDYHEMLMTTSMDHELVFEFKGSGLWLWLDLGYTNYRVDIYVNGNKILTDWAIEGGQVKLLSKFLAEGQMHVLRIVPKSAANSSNPFSFGLRGIIVSK